LPEWASEFDASSWAQFFLKYVVSHPAITCAIPGTTKISHLEDNQRAARGRMPDAAMRKRMEAFWDGLS
jgi:aryl-alcohol dehydrogenase-like predicted oxidoreductase